MKRIIFGSLIVVALCISGCASIMSGTTQKVAIDSDPKGAKITIGEEKTQDGKKIMINSYYAGITPLTVAISRKDAMIELSKEGYKTQEVELQRGYNAWVWGDVLLTSLLSTSIDTSTGAWHEYKPGQYMITLVPANAPENTPTKAPANTPTTAPENKMPWQ